MSAKAIREYDGKLMLSQWLKTHGFSNSTDHFIQIIPTTQLSKLPSLYPWISSSRLVAKPDQLIKRRGKAGLISLNKDWNETQKWIEERRDKTIKVEKVEGVLDHFIIEEFTPHNVETDESYICIQNKRNGDEILFHHQGGVDIGNVDAKALRYMVDVGEKLSEQIVTEKLLINVKTERRACLAKFIAVLYEFYTTLNFAYLEINPIVVNDKNEVFALDLAAKIDETGKFLSGHYWHNLEFPPPFGRPQLPAEQHISELDGKTGASLKLTILNEKGRIWTMVAGGGASVIYADTICDLGAGAELANYGEYSGAPDENSTYEYAKTILELMTKEKDPRGKILLIGGGIANFTNVASTFKGIIKALTKFADILIEHHIKIYVRRAGPNYQEGLEMMRQLAQKLDLDIEVYGPEAHMTAIVPMALGLPIKLSQPIGVPRQCERGNPLKPVMNGVQRKSGTENVQQVQPAVPQSKLDSAMGAVKDVVGAAKNALGVSLKPEKSTPPTRARDNSTGVDSSIIPSSPPQTDWYNLFTNKTRALIYGMQPGAVQNMLDFDFICGRQFPSVAGMVYPFSGNHFMKFYWQTKEILLPIYQSLAEAIKRFPEVDVIVNFSSFRSVYESTMDILKFSQIRTIAIIAEGVPERQTREINKAAKQNNVTIIGPATVGGIKPGCFRIGNTGGMLDNIIASKLYRPGSIAYVARSGGMSNELNNIISQNSDGVYEGIAIGGDKYPGTTFIDHLLRYQANEEVKMMIVLGEVGGVEEYEICRLIQEKKLTKPIVGWCIGTCAKIFPYEVQFGHAGACAGVDRETADAKNAALKAAGVHVPNSFEDFGIVINQVYAKLVDQGIIIPKPEMPPPTIPVDYEWARKLGLIRKPSSFISSIVDERGEELMYGGMKISEVIGSGLGVGGTIGLIWFRKRLPDYFCRFIELILVVTADHGPAVSGAHNTIVCARAGKDLISSLVSGLLTIGPRFGGALDGAAQKFSWAYDAGMTAEQFVTHMRKEKELIMGIGHKIKSLENPDVRVVIIKDFCRKYFKSTQILDFACQVEQVTTKKKSNLILNVDGAIGAAFVDLLRSSEAFTLEEANEYVQMGTLNGLFVLGRSIGFIGHFLDQNRLKQPLYRHPIEDISYLTNEGLSM